MFYIIGFILLGIGLCELYFEKFEKNKTLIILMIGLWIILSSRGFLGTDWYFYYPSFMEKTYIYEKGYMLYTSLIGGIYKSYPFYQSITLGIDFICLYFLFKKYSKYPILTFGIFYCIQGLFMEVELLRNMKAIILFMFSLRFIENKKIIPYMLLNIVGVSFHQSAILYLPLYFILRIKYDRKIILTLFVLGSLIYICNIDILISSLEKISMFLGGNLGNKIDNYIKVIPKNIPRGINMFFLERVLLFIIAYFYEKNNILKNIAFISIYIFLYTSELSIVSVRIGTLFIFITWLLYSRVFDNFKYKKTTSILILIICVFRLHIGLSYPGNKINYSSENLFFKKLNYQKREKELIESKKYLESSHGKELLIQY